MGTYTVVSGDTLSGIAARYGWSWQNLYHHAENTDFRALRPNPDLIHPGDVLWVPSQDDADGGGSDAPDASPPPAPAPPLGRRPRVNPRMLAGVRMLHPYKVRDGDTLANIAERLGCRWQDLARLNWGTEEPEEINWYLEHYFVCTRRFGANYVFSSTDEPGLLLLPARLDPSAHRRRRRFRATPWPVT